MGDFEMRIEHYIHLALMIAVVAMGVSLYETQHATKAQAAVMACSGPNCMSGSQQSCGSPNCMREAPVAKPEHNSCSGPNC